MRIPVDDKTIQARKKIAEILAQEMVLNYLKTSLPEGIIAIEPAQPKLDANGRPIIINCYAHALDLSESKLYELLCKFDYDSEDENDDVKEKQPQKLNGVRTVSMSYIEEKRLIKLEAPEKGCRVLYFDSHNKLRHAGIVMEPNGEDSIIQSSWGSLGVFTHKLGYVPDGSSNSENDYGIEVKFYKRPSTEQSEDYFYEFLKSRANLEIYISGEGRKSVELLLESLPPTKKERDELTIDKLYRKKS